jgi:hypothetical protein
MATGFRKTERRTVPSVIPIAVLALAAIACGGEDARPAATGQPSAVPTGVLRTAPTPALSTGPKRDWQRIAVVEGATDASGGWRRLAGSPIGYVAISSVPAAIWFSPDGVAWAKTRLEVPEGTALAAEAVAGGTESIVVGGDYTPCSRTAYSRNPFGECRPRPASWVSTDGRTWRASPGWNGRIGDPGRAGSVFNAVWPVPGDGWDAAQAFDASDESDDFDLAGPAIWHSPDGLHWELLKRYEGRCGSDVATSGLRGAADASSRRVLAGDVPSCDPRVWSSADGRAWAPVGAIGTQWPIEAVLPATTDRPWRLFGFEADANFDPIAIGVWRSTDLDTWTVDRLPPGAKGAIVLAAADGGDFDVAVGFGEDHGLTWSSEDGLTWEVAASPGIEAVAAGPAGLLGLIGTWDGAGNTVTGFEVWKLAER